MPGESVLLSRSKPYIGVGRMCYDLTENRTYPYPQHTPPEGHLDRYQTHGNLCVHHDYVIITGFAASLRGQLIEGTEFRVCYDSPREGLGSVGTWYAGEVERLFHAVMDGWYEWLHEALTFKDAEIGERCLYKVPTFPPSDPAREAF